MDEHLGEKRFETAEFALLKPFCYAIMKDANEVSFQRFDDVLRTIETPPPHLSDFVVFPFAVHLKTFEKLRGKTRTQFLQTFAKVLRKFPLINWDMYIGIFQRLHVALGKTEDPTKVNEKLPDDELDGIISCIQSLLNTSLPLHIELQFGETKLQTIAHSVVLMLQVATSDGSKNSRISALGILNTYVKLCTDKKNESIRLFNFLPGVVSGIRKVVNIRQGKTIFALYKIGLNLFSDFIIVSTSYIGDEDASAVDSNISCVISCLFDDIVSFGNEDIKYKKCCLDVFSKFLGSVRLPSCRDVIIGYMLMFKSDSNDSISECASDILTTYKDNVLITFDDVMTEINKSLEFKMGCNDSRLLISLSKVCTYVSLCSLNFYELVDMCKGLFKLFYLLVDKCKNQIEDSSYRSDPFISLIAKVSCNMCCFQKFEDCTQIFLTSLYDFEFQPRDYQIGLLTCLNQFYIHLKVHMCSDINLGDVLELSNALIEVLNSQSSEVALNSLNEMCPKEQSLTDFQKSLALESLCTITNLKPVHVIPTTLYVVIENCGNSNPVLQETALKCLQRLSEPNSPQTFLHQNLLYILNDLSVRINNLALYPHCPYACMFLAKYFDFSEGSLVDVVENALSKSCDPMNASGSEGLFMQVFLAYLISIEKFQLTTTDDQSKSVSGFLSHVNTVPQSLLSKLIEYQKSIDITISKEGLEDGVISEDAEDKIEETSANGNENSDNTPSTPVINLTNRICRRVLNSMPHQDKVVKLLTMDCLIKGTLILSYEENVLLPLAHTIWQNLSPRFQEKDYLVIRKSFELLLTLCTTCGTFLKKRIVKEIFPVLSSILVSLAKESEMVSANNHTFFKHTQAYKLQDTLLQGIYDLCHTLDIQETGINRVIDGCLIYINSKQHPKLKEAALRLIEDFSKNDTYARCIWMKLVYHGLLECPVKPKIDEFRDVPLNFTMP